MVFTPVNFPEDVTLWRQSAWAIPLELWGPKEGQVAGNANPTFSIIAQRGKWQILLKAGDRLPGGQQSISNVLVPFKWSRQTWVIDYYAHATEGTLNVTLDGDEVTDYSGTTILTGAGAGAKGPATQLGMYGSSPWGFLIHSVSIREKLNE